MYVSHQQQLVSQLPGGIIITTVHRKASGEAIMASYGNECLSKWSVISVITGKGQDLSWEAGSLSDIPA